MKRHVTVCATVVAVAALASAVPRRRDYRIPLFRARLAVAGANLVPANTPLYFDGGWTTGNRGLVQDAINDAGVFIHRHASRSHDRSHCGVGPDHAGQLHLRWFMDGQLSG